MNATGTAVWCAASPGLEVLVTPPVLPVEVGSPPPDSLGGTVVGTVLVVTEPSEPVIVVGTSVLTPLPEGDPDPETEPDIEPEPEPESSDVE